MTKGKIVLILIIITFTSSLLYGSDITLEEFSAKLSAETGNIEEVIFEFTQDIYVAGSTDTVKAEIFYKRPGLFFVDYTRPLVQKIYFNGEELVTYTPRIRQATSRKTDYDDRILGVSAGLIFSPGGLEDLKKDHEVELAGKENEKIKVIAVPVKKREYDEMVIMFDSQTLRPLKVHTYAPHARSVTRFDNYRINTGIENEVFNFEPPDNVDFIRINNR